MCVGWLIVGWTDVGGVEHIRRHLKVVEELSVVVHLGCDHVACWLHVLLPVIALVGEILDRPRLAYAVV